MFRLLEESGFGRVRSAVVPGFRFRKQSTQNSAEAYGVKAVMMMAEKPGGQTD
jgi:hypothetical protein